MVKFFKSPYLHLALYSFALTGCVSALITVALSPWCKSYTTVFCISTALQFILFFIVNTLLERRDALLVIQNQIENANKDLILETKLNCAYCNQITEKVPVSFTRDNKFTCDYCKLTNGIKIQILPTQLITPVENVPAKIVEAVKKN
jgi:hypothetical protein